MCSILSKTHTWVATTMEWTSGAWLEGDTIETTWSRELILQCRHCSARKKIVTRVTL